MCANPLIFHDLHYLPLEDTSQAPNFIRADIFWRNAMNTFTKTTDLLQRAMDVAYLRYEVSVNNLANVEVPNFKKQKVNFESELKKALESDKKHQA